MGAALTSEPSVRRLEAWDLYRIGKQSWDNQVGHSKLDVPIRDL